MRAINRALIFKCVSDCWWLFAALALLMFSFCWLRVWVVSLIEMSRFVAILQPIFDKYSYMSPVPFSHVTTYPGRVALTFIEPVVFFGLSIWAISRGSDIVSGEIGRGTMEMLLGQPLSRLQVFVTQATTTVIGAALLCVVCWLGLWAGIQTTKLPEEKPVIPFNIFGTSPDVEEVAPKTRRMSDEVSATPMWAGVANLFCLSFCVAGITTLVSAFDRYRWRTIGIATGIFILQLIVKGLAVAAEPLQWLKAFSFFTAFEPQWYVYAAVEKTEMLSFVYTHHETESLEPGVFAFSAILLGIGAATYLVGAIVFCKRDLPAPL